MLLLVCAFGHCLILLTSWKLYHPVLHILARYNIRLGCTSLDILPRVYLEVLDVPVVCVGLHKDLDAPFRRPILHVLLEAKPPLEGIMASSIFTH